MNILFARTRYEYASYQDFWKLVELSRFKVCYVDEIDLAKEATYITTPINGEIRPHITHRRSILNGKQRARLIWWNLERPDDKPGEGRHIPSVVDDLLEYVDAVWCSDRHYTTLDPRMKHAVLGSHSGLCLSGTEQLRYDFAHMGNYSARRKPVYDRLKALGLREAPNGWGEARSKTLRETHVMLNVHQHDNPMPIAETLRFAVAAAHAMPLLSETLADPWPLVQDADHAQASYEELVPSGEEFTKRLSKQRLGAMLFYRLCLEWTFRRGVEEALK